MGKKYAIDESTLKDIAIALRQNGNISYLILPTDMPNEISNVFTRGYKNGAVNGLDLGKGIGKQEAYDAFWDVFQNSGERTEYYSGFAGAGWTTETFKPKYDIKPSGSTYGIFQKSRISGDLAEIAEEQGIEIDFSSSTNLQYGFSNTYFTRIGVIDSSKNDSMIRAFEINPNLKTIDKIILKQDGSTNLANAFNQCTALEEIRFDGVIGTNGANFGDSYLLSYESLMSIISALSDRSGESTAYTCTLGEENLAKLTQDEISLATDKGWTLL